MAERPKILFQYQLALADLGSQAEPGTNGPTSGTGAGASLVAHSVPNSMYEIFSTLAAVNRNPTPQRVWIAIVKAANISAWSDVYYLYYKATVPPNDTAQFTIGLTLTAGDQIRFFSDSLNVALHGYGVEGDLS